MTDNADERLTCRQAAEYLWSKGVDRFACSTAKDLKRAMNLIYLDSYNGKLPQPVAHGRKSYRWLRSELDAFVRERAIQNFTKSARSLAAALSPQEVR